MQCVRSNALRFGRRVGCNTTRSIWIVPPLWNNIKIEIGTPSPMPPPEPIVVPVIPPFLLKQNFQEQDPSALFSKTGCLDTVYCVPTLPEGPEFIFLLESHSVLSTVFTQLPTTTWASVLTWVHESFELTWFWTVIACTLSARLLISPLFVYGQYNSAWLAKAKHAPAEGIQVWSEARELEKDKKALVIWRHRLRVQKKLAAVKQGIAGWKGGLSLICTAPLYSLNMFSIFRICRESDDVINPDQAGAWLDLMTEPDPYGVFPVVGAIGISCLPFLSFSTTSHDTQRYMMCAFAIGSGVVSVFIFLNYPAMSTVFFASNAVCNFIQLGMLRTRVRYWLGFPPKEDKVEKKEADFESIETFTNKVRIGRQLSLCSRSEKNRVSALFKEKLQQQKLAVPTIATAAVQ